LVISHGAESTLY